MSRCRNWARVIARWWVGATTPSGSRWGIFAFLLAIAFFLCEGSGMLGQLLPAGSGWQQALFVLGLFFFALAITLGLLWLTRGSKDTTPQELRNIKQELKEIKDILKGGEANGSKSGNSKTT